MFLLGLFWRHWTKRVPLAFLCYSEDPWLGSCKLTNLALGKTWHESQQERFSAAASKRCSSAGRHCRKLAKCHLCSCLSEPSSKHFVSDLSCQVNTPVSQPSEHKELRGKGWIGVLTCHKPLGCLRSCWCESVVAHVTYSELLGSVSQGRTEETVAMVRVQEGWLLVKIQELGKTSN